MDSLVAHVFWSGFLGGWDFVPHTKVDKVVNQLQCPDGAETVP